MKDCSKSRESNLCICFSRSKCKQIAIKQRWLKTRSRVVRKKYTAPNDGYSRSWEFRVFLTRYITAIFRELHTQRDTVFANATVSRKDTYRTPGTPACSSRLKVTGFAHFIQLSTIVTQWNYSTANLWRILYTATNNQTLFTCKTRNSISK